MKDIINKVGIINLHGSVDITDPCYGTDVWCRMTIKDIQPGPYECFYEKRSQKKGNWENVSRARIVLADGSEHAKSTMQRVVRGRSWRYIGDIGVDAGMAGFFANKPNFDDNEWSKLCDWIFHGENEGKMAFVKTFHNGSDGFWTESGYGDGGYPVYAIRTVINGESRITALEVRFL